ncbi:MAG TPA: gas vesicle protein [Thermoleophilia bacterium]
MAIERGTAHSLQSTNLADLLERILDKGIVIAGDIRVNLVEVELLTIQIRLVICSVDKAREMGMDWWVNNPAFSARAKREEVLPEMVDKFEERLARIETSLAAAAPMTAFRPMENVRRKGAGRPAGRQR